MQAAVRRALLLLILPILAICGAYVAAPGQAAAAAPGEAVEVEADPKGADDVKADQGEAAAPAHSRGKYKTNLLTPEEIEQARRTRTWPGTGAAGAAMISQADRWMKYSLSELRAMVPGPEIPRAYDVHRKQSPVNSEAILRVGRYPWLIDPDRPYKLVNPVDGSVFPTNDFDPRNPGTPDDVSSEPYVDTGWGWRDPNDPHKYWFVAYYAHWLWLNHLVPAAEALGQAYILTGDRRYARQAAALLDRIAEVYPAMDYDTQSREGTEIFSGTYPGRIVNTIWETDVVKKLARAYDYIFAAMTEPDPELEAATGKSMTQIRANIERNLLEDAARSIVTMDDRIRGNFGMHHSALATIAIVLDNENSDRYIDWLLHQTGGGAWPYEGIVPGLVNFVFRDGAPNESSPGYNSLWMNHFHLVAQLLERRGIDLWAELPKLKLLYSMPIRLGMPGGFTPNIGDTGSVNSSGIVGVNPTLHYEAYQRYRDPLLFSQRPPETSDNMSAYGLAMLRRGTGSRGMGLSLYYGTAGGHGHWDQLNIELFAKGRRILPDLGYPEYADAYHKKRFGWTSHTVSHNTVLVDESRQRTKEGGRLQVFASSPAVQYVDVRAEEAYARTIDRYQRAVAMIDVSDEDAYVVDVFRVKGGRRHDYSIHGPDGTFSVEDLELGPVQERGTLAGEEVPFGYLYDAPHMEAPGYTGTYTGYSGSGFSYLRNVQRGRPDGAWRADWRTPARAGVRVTFLPGAADEVAVADGEPPVNGGNPPSLKYVLARRAAAGEEPLESVFVTLIEPYSGEPFLGEAAFLGEAPADAASPVALSVQRADGVDYIFQSPDPSRLHAAAGTRFQGRLGVVSRDGDGAVRFAYLLGGGRVEQGDLTIEAPGSYTGEIVAVDFAAQQATVRLDARPPEGSSGGAPEGTPATQPEAIEQAIVGQRIVIFNDEHATEYIVREAAAVEGGRYRLTLGDTEFLTGMGQLGDAPAPAAGSSADLVTVRSRTPLVLGPYYKGQWFVGGDSGEGRRIVGFSSGPELQLAGGALPVEAGDPFRIYDFGPGDRFEIASAVFVRAESDGVYRVTSNVPAAVRLSDGAWHRVGPGEASVRVAVPRIVWGEPSGDGPVRGTVAVQVDVEMPTGISLREVAVRLGDVELYRGEAPPARGAVVVDTTALAEGEHRLQVTVVDSLERRFTVPVAFEVDNAWELVDDLRPPIGGGWFTFDFTKTVDRSAGWTSRTDRPVDHFGDSDRQVRQPGSNDVEYLTWETPRLQAFEATLYAPSADAAAAVWLHVSNDRREWREVAAEREVEGPNGAGLYRLRLSGRLDELDSSERDAVQFFRLSVAPGEAAEALQVGKVVLRGLNR